MLREKRHKRILSILQREGAVSIDALSSVMPEISRVTLRRDLAELAEAGALKRTHGGATLPDEILIRRAGKQSASEILASAIDDFDAIILPPIDGRGSDALRRDICRRAIPFLAESAPQDGGAYLGPDNYTASFELGQFAGQSFNRKAIHALIIGHPELSNTQARADGFEAGLRDVFGDKLTVQYINGQGYYKKALRMALDAMQTNQATDIIFAVNDHSAVAGIEAAQRCELSPAVYAAGGENADFVGRLAERSLLKGVAAFFPEVVGTRAIDAVAEVLSGQDLTENITPHALINQDNLLEFYEQSPDAGWRLRIERQTALAGPYLMAARRAPMGKRIGFMPHFPAHDWYRTMIASMQSRAENYGFELIVTPPHQGIAAEIIRLQQKIACAAMHRIQPGQVIGIGEGQLTLLMAHELRKLAFSDDPRVQGLTIVTNALDVVHSLEDAPHLKVILTSGEYQSTDRCLVGPSLGAIFDHVRPDCSFIAVGGITESFGISAVDERRALVGQRFVKASTRTIALVDNTIIGTDANHRIARMVDIDEIITDDGTLAIDRQALRTSGVEVSIAGEMATDQTSRLPTGVVRKA